MDVAIESAGQPEACCIVGVNSSDVADSACRSFGVGRSLRSSLAMMGMGISTFSRYGRKKFNLRFPWSGVWVALLVSLAAAAGGCSAADDAPRVCSSDFDCRDGEACG